MVFNAKLKGTRRKKPWIDRKVRTAIRKKARLYTRMKKTKKEKDIRKYRQCKGDVQKLERQAYFLYINNIIEVNDDQDDKPSKQKRFWSYIKSLRKDITGITPLKDKGRLFNSPKDKATILNRQYLLSPRKTQTRSLAHLAHHILTWKRLR